MSDELYKNQVEIKDIPDEAIIVDVRNGSEHYDIALKQKHYFVETTRFNAKEFIKAHNLNGEQVLVLCQSGKRASKVAQKLEDAGYKNVAIIKGGMAEVSKQSSLVDKACVMSLERQVRIVAGCLIILGSILGLTVNVYFVLLALFVGCGLLYAGISNSCAMAGLLGKLPWNKK